MKKFLESIVGILAVLVYYVGTGFIHLYTAWLVYYNFGTFWGIIAFMCPRS